MFRYGVKVADVNRVGVRFDSHYLNFKERKAWIDRIWRAGWGPAVNREVPFHVSWATNAVPEVLRSQNCLNKCASLVSQDIKIGVNMDFAVQLPPAGKTPDMWHERVGNAIPKDAK